MGGYPGEPQVVPEAEEKEVITPMPRAELLVRNGFDQLGSVALETRQKTKFVFLLAHPDDEASHLVYLHMLRSLGFPVQILWLTYGDASTDKETKIKESTQVVSTIEGIEMTFLPNGVMEVLENVFKTDNPEIRKMTLEKIVAQVRNAIGEARVIVTNAFEGGHIQHDFANLVARSIGETQGKAVLEIPQYSVKTIKGIIASAIRSLLHLEWGSHVFYNAGEFREGKPTQEVIDLGEGVQLPTALELTNAAVTSKAGLVRLYKSQWNEVFSKLLEVVEFNGSEVREYLRPAQPIARLYSTIMHWEKIIKSWFGKVVHPKKLYEVQEVLEDIAAKTRVQSGQQ